MPADIVGPARGSGGAPPGLGSCGVAVARHRSPDASRSLRRAGVGSARAGAGCSALPPTAPFRSPGVLAEPLSRSRQRRRLTRAGQWSGPPLRGKRWAGQPCDDTLRLPSETETAASYRAQQHQTPVAGPGSEPTSTSPSKPSAVRPPQRASSSFPAAGSSNAPGRGSCARRHCRHHERLPEMSESLITWAAITVMTGDSPAASPDPLDGRMPTAHDLARAACTCTRIPGLQPAKMP